MERRDSQLSTITEETQSQIQQEEMDQDTENERNKNKPLKRRKRGKRIRRIEDGDGDLEMTDNINHNVRFEVVRPGILERRLDPLPRGVSKR